MIVTVAVAGSASPVAGRLPSSAVSTAVYCPSNGAPATGPLTVTEPSWPSVSWPPWLLNVTLGLGPARAGVLVAAPRAAARTTTATAPVVRMSVLLQVGCGGPDCARPPLSSTCGRLEGALKSSPNSFPSRLAPGSGSRGRRAATMGPARTGTALVRVDL